MKITPGRDTTYYDGPLRDDGTVDYIAAINAEMSRGVKPENNAFLALVNLLPADAFHSQALRRATYTQLEAEMPAEGDGPRFVRWFEGPLSHTSEAGSDTRFLEHPWRAEDYPGLSVWLEENQPALDALYVAFERPHYFSPMSAIEEHDRLATVLLPMLGAARGISAAVLVRANLRLGEGDIAGALDDAVLLLRLGAVMEDESLEIGLLITGSITVQGLETIHRVLRHETLTKDAARRLVERMDALEPPRNILIEKTSGEARLFVLESAQGMIYGRMTMEEIVSSVHRKRLTEEDGTPSRWRKSLFASADAAAQAEPDVVLRRINEVADLRGERNLDEGYAARKRAAQIQGENMERRYSAAIRLLQAEETSSRDRAVAAADLMVGLLWFEEWAPQRFSFHLATQWRATRVAVALSAYRHEHGQYPETLDALVPAYFDRLPADPLDPEGGPLRYTLGEDAAMVYSVGFDGDDDGGRVDDGEADGDLPLLLPVE